MRNVDEDKELERYEILRSLVHTKLQETGEIEKLRYYARRKLSAVGWKNDMMKELRAAVNEKGSCNVTVQNLYERISPLGRRIDQRAANDIIRKIKNTYKEALHKNDDGEMDGVSDVLTNNTVVNNQYINNINEHRN